MIELSASSIAAPLTHLQFIHLFWYLSFRLEEPQCGGELVGGYRKEAGFDETEMGDEEVKEVQQEEAVEV